MNESSKQNVLILATDGVERVELIDVQEALEKRGIQVSVVSPEGGTIRGLDGIDWGEDIDGTKALADVRVEDFDALYLPGGVINPDLLRLNEDAIALIRNFGRAEKPIASICHGPWLLITAGLVDGKRVAAWPSLKDDIQNAGGHFTDEAAVTDGRLVTARKPDDIPQFVEAFVGVIEGARQAERV